MRILILLLVLGLSGCAVASVKNPYCSIASPITLQHGEAAQLSDSTAKQILEHNKTWAKLCK